MSQSVKGHIPILYLTMCHLVVNTSCTCVHVVCYTVFCYIIVYIFPYCCNSACFNAYNILQITYPEKISKCKVYYVLSICNSPPIWCTDENCINQHHVTTQQARCLYNHPLRVLIMHQTAVKTTNHGANS